MATDRGFFTKIDERHLARARRGDPVAHEDLYRAFSEPVYTLAVRLCRTPEEAEEVLQETFLEVFRSIGRFRGEGAVGAWVRRIAVSKALMALRRRNRLRGEVTTSFDEDGRALDVFPVADRTRGWSRVDLERALARLPDASRCVVWLHDVEGLTHAEIADIFGRSPSYSKSQLSRAHARLRAWLGRTGGAEDASEFGRTAGAARR